MSFAIGETINQIADRVLSAPIVSTVAKDPLYSALLITLIIVLLVMFTFRDAEMEDSLLGTSLGLGFYVFMCVATVLFLNNRVLMRDTSDSGKNSEVETVFQPIPSSALQPVTGAYEDTIVPVSINTNFP